MFGASGFVGGWAAKYLAEKYGNTIKWAIAGRNRKKLEAVLSKLNIKVPIIIADSENIEQLAEMVN